MTLFWELPLFRCACGLLQSTIAGANSATKVCVDSPISSTTLETFGFKIMLRNFTALLGVRAITSSPQISSCKNGPFDLYFSNLQIKIGDSTEMLLISLFFWPFIVPLPSRACLVSNCMDRSVVTFFRATALWSVDRDGLFVESSRWGEVLKTSGVGTKPCEPTESVTALTAVLERYVFFCIRGFSWNAFKRTEDGAVIAHKTSDAIGCLHQNWLCDDVKHVGVCLKSGAYKLLPCMICNKIWSFETNIDAALLERFPERLWRYVVSHLAGRKFPFIYEMEG